MYDYNLASSNAKQKHQDMIAEAAHLALVREQRRLHRSANRRPNHLLVAITHLFTR